MRNTPASAKYHDFLLLLVEGYCPTCGAELPEGAVACPECGSCEETGWSERARYDSLGVDYDADEFNYEEFVENEFGKAKPALNRRQIVISIVALLLIVIFIASYL